MFKILIKAGYIPLGSIVTKRTGEKQYIINNKLRIFDEVGDKKEIKADQGCRFIISDRGDANVIASDKELLWYAEESDLIELIER